MVEQDEYAPYPDVSTDDPQMENGRFAPPPSPLPPETLSTPEPPPKKRSGCWMGIIAALVILSLLAFALISVFQFGQNAMSSWTPPWATATPALAEAGRIAYIGPGGQVYTAQPNGENRRQLTADEFPYQFPAWARQSNQLAALGGGGIVSLTDADDPAQTVIYQGDGQSPFYLYWSPDGSQISFLSNSQRGIALSVAAADGSSEAEIRSFGTPFYWDWLGDSRQMLVHTGAVGEDARLGLLQADGSVEQIAPPGAFQAPGISANGRYWAYAEDVGAGQSWLVISDTETGEQWTERHTGVVAMSWSPAADKLAFISGLQNKNSFWGPLRLFDIETGDVTLLSDNFVLAFFWSPDGRYLATINTGDIDRDTGVNVAQWTKPARGIEMKTAVQPTPHQFNLAVIDVENGTEEQVASFFPTGVFIAQFLPFFDQYALSHNIWSPNSDAVVLPMRQEGESRVKVVRIDGSEVLDLGQGDMPFWSR
ncbi:MAG: hypothetical protein R6X34_06770 [Chloroflexota bacterium]